MTGGKEDAPCSEYHYREDFDVKEDVKEAFVKNGYIILRGLFSEAEITKLRLALENDEGVMTQHYGRDDGAGRRTKAVLWNHPGNDITGVVARTEKVAGTFEKLLGGEVYHYHAKVIMKEPNTGGAHIWHQDYGYWYENGCLFPDMGTVWVALDPAKKINGCLQVLQGSHRLGRLDHVTVGQQVGADTERVDQASKVCPLIYVEMEPGDALFFHCNVLHRSDQNSSDLRRWAYLVAYNKADNNPVYKHHHPQYTPLDKMPNSAIMKCSTDTDMAGKDFFKGPSGDFSLEKVQNKKA